MCATGPGRFSSRDARIVPALLGGLVFLAGMAAMPVAAQDRRFVPYTVDTLWTVGGTEADTTLLIPVALAATDSAVYVLDRGEPRVAAFSASDGRLLWLRGRRGGGPQEFRHPTAVEVAASGAILVADAENARIERLGPDGRWLPSVPLADVAYVHGLCALSNDRLVLGLHADTMPILTLRDGRPLARHALPWPDLARAPELAAQTMLTSSPDHRDCVIGLYLGRGFTVFRDGGLRPATPYIEAFELPGVETRTRGNTIVSVVTEPQVALAGAAVTDSTIVFGFAGLTDRKRRILDVYGRDGGYRYSLLLDGQLRGLAWAGGTFYVSALRNGYPMLHALRIRR